MKRKNKLQAVLSEPGKIFKEKYTTKSGQKKKRYIVNKNAKVVKFIKHK